MLRPHFDALASGKDVRGKTPVHAPYYGMRVWPLAALLSLSLPASAETPDALAFTQGDIISPEITIKGMGPQMWQHAASEGCAPEGGSASFEAYWNSLPKEKRLGCLQKTDAWARGQKDRLNAVMTLAGVKNGQRAPQSVKDQDIRLVQEWMGPGHAEELAGLRRRAGGAAWTAGQPRPELVAAGNAITKFKGFNEASPLCADCGATATGEPPNQLTAAAAALPAEPAQARRTVRTLDVPGPTPAGSGAQGNTVPSGAPPLSLNAVFDSQAGALKQAASPAASTAEKCTTVLTHLILGQPYKIEPKGNPLSAEFAVHAPQGTFGSELHAEVGEVSLSAGGEVTPPRGHGSRLATGTVFSAGYKSFSAGVEASQNSRSTEFSYERPGGTQVKFTRTTENRQTAINVTASAPTKIIANTVRKIVGANSHSNNPSLLPGTAH